MSSGLYGNLIKSELIVPHEEVNETPAESDSCYKVIKPSNIPFISYPYEWSFSQYKDAATALLNIQSKAIEHGMTLKDASAYNMQFYRGKPVIIDTLSFEKYTEGSPWIAYRQFCQHFIAPLSLMVYRDIRLCRLMQLYIDGIPLDMTSKLLPLRTRFKPSLLTHIHLHQVSQRRHSGTTMHDSSKDELKQKKGHFSRMAMLGLIDSLNSAVKAMQWNPSGTEWADYYDNTNYTDEAFKQKKEIIGDWLQILSPDRVWDLGANDGTFADIAVESGAFTVAFDVDPSAVEKAYLKNRKALESKSKSPDEQITGEQINKGCMLPLLMDLTNPSSAIGWDNEERQSFVERAQADTVMALALIHHICISNNVPLARLASFLRGICNSLIIEFVPKEDSQVKRLLVNRQDVFFEYDKDGFERNFNEFFHIDAKESIDGTSRILYRMTGK